MWSLILLCIVILLIFLLLIQRSYYKTELRSNEWTITYYKKQEKYWFDLLMEHIKSDIEKDA